MGNFPGEVCCFKYYRRVGVDNVVRLGEHRLQTMPSNSRQSYAHARVEVQERLDGSLAVHYQGHCLVTKAAPEEAPVLRTRQLGHFAWDKAENNAAHSASSAIPPAPGPKPPLHKPAPDHPWRGIFRVDINRG